MVHWSVRSDGPFFVLAARTHGRITARTGLPPRNQAEASQRHRIAASAARARSKHYQTRTQGSLEAYSGKTEIVARQVLAVSAQNLRRAGRPRKIICVDMRFHACMKTSTTTAAASAPPAP